METTKFEKAALPAPPFLIRHGFGLLAALACASLGGNLVLLAWGGSAAIERDAWRDATAASRRSGDRLERENADLKGRLDEMAKTAGAYRSYEVYNDCVQQGLGIYQVPEVKAAYEQFFSTTELSAKCLAESAWYETHPVGINPAHLHR